LKPRGQFDADALECLAAIVEEGGFEAALPCACRSRSRRVSVAAACARMEAQAGTGVAVLQPALAAELRMRAGC